MFAAAFVASASRAQPVRRPVRIGVVTEGFAANHPTVLGFRTGLGDLGLEEGRDVALDIRFTEGSAEATQHAVESLLGSGVGLLFACNELAAVAAKRAGGGVPIVFAQVRDPVAAGLVASLARPGGEVTGVSTLAIELAPKRVELLKTLQPQLRRVWFVQPRNDSGTVQALAQLRQSMPRLDVDVLAYEAADVDAIGRLRAQLRPGDALMSSDDDAREHTGRLLKLSLDAAIPAVFASAFWVGYGGLLSYGPDYHAQGKQAARLAAKILRGARPAELPVEDADSIDLAINVRTAASMGIVVPPKILLRADTIRR